MTPMIGSLWDRVLGDVANQLPRFNDELLLKFREEKIASIGDYLDELFHEVVLLFDGQLIYTGYRTATPEERIQHYLKDKIINKKMQIQENTLKLFIFEFEFENQKYTMPVHVPYMDNHKILMGGVEYYPMFAMVERVIHMIKDGIRIKVLKAPLSFWKQKEKVTITESGKVFRESMITVRIHQWSKSSKKPDTTPLCLYHFIAMGLFPTLAKYGYKDGDLTFTTEPGEEVEDYEFIKVRKDIFIKVHKDILADRYKLRVLLSLQQIIEFESRVTIEDLIDPDANYYKFCLGKYTAAATNNRRLLMQRAVDHLATNVTMVDPPAKRAFKAIGMEVNDLDDLLFLVFYNIDQWMNNRPNNLFEKKIGTLDILMQGLVRAIFLESYRIINNKKVGLSSKTLGRLMRSAGLNQWKDVGLFSVKPTIYNDNWLLSIGASRTKSLELSEMGTKGKGKGKKGGGKPPMALIKAHYSQLACETVLTIPTSKPCETGTINPYMEVDEIGNIQEPTWTESLKHIYD